MATAAAHLGLSRATVTHVLNGRADEQRICTGSLLYGVTQAIAEKDLRLVLTQVPDGVISDESCLPHTMRELSVDGALINRHVGFPLPFLEQVHRLRIPAVSLNV